MQEKFEKKQKTMLEKYGIKGWWKNKKRTELVKLKISHSLTGYKQSTKHKEHLSYAKQKGGLASIKSIYSKPNKSEKRLDILLQKHFPNEYKFVGDGSFILAGKNPDFINCNGKKIIIELFGNYHHFLLPLKTNPNFTKEQAEIDRIAIFKPYGFETIIIWHNELKEPDNIIKKIMEIHKFPCGSHLNLSEGT